MLDISLNSDIFVKDKLDAAIQELDMIFNTENTELIGYPTYGTNWWTYLWELTSLESDLQKYIEDKIAETFFLSQYITVVEVQFVRGTENSIYYVKITIKNNNGEELTVQQYELN